MARSMLALASVWMPQAASPASSPSGAPTWRCDGVGRGLRVEPHGAAVEIVGVDVAEHDVGIRDGRLLAAAAVADGAWIGTGALRPDLDQPHVGVGDAAAAGADLQQLDGRHVDRQAAALAVAHLVHLEGGRDGGLAAVDGAELGRGAAHVEGEDPVEALLLADGAAQQHAGGGPELDDADRHVAGELGRHQPAVRLHDEEIRGDTLLLEGACQPADVAADDGLDVGVGHHRAGALVFAILGRDVGGERHGRCWDAFRQALRRWPSRARGRRRRAAGTPRSTRSSRPRSRPSTSLEGRGVERLLDGAVGQGALAPPRRCRAAAPAAPAWPGTYRRCRSASGGR